MKRITKGVDVSIIYLRIFATFLILLHHTIFIYCGWRSSLFAENILVLSLSSLFKYAGLGIFFFISGKLFASQTQKLSTKQFFIKKLNRIILPGIGIAILYSCISNQNCIKLFFGSFIWYLPTLFILLLISRLFNHKIILRYDFFKHLIIIVILYILSKIIDSFCFNCISFYFVFFLGYYFEFVRNRMSNSTLKKIIIFLNVLVFWLFFYSEYIKFLYPFIVSPIIAVDMYIISSKFKQNPTIFHLVNKYSLEIYLFQFFFMHFIFNLLNELQISWEISILLIFILVLTLCIVTAHILSYIKNKIKSYDI